MKSLIVTPPLIRFRPPKTADNRPTIFLGGSIEMGKADDWQAEAIDHFEGNFSVIYNPRRADWDNSWAQDINSIDFNNQVNWELDMIERADYVLLHFEPETKSPITLLELGVVSQRKPDNTVVSCPEGFYRRGNVQIVCERYGVHFVDDLSKAYAIIA